MHHEQEITERYATSHKNEGNWKTASGSRDARGKKHHLHKPSKNGSIASPHSQVAITSPTPCVNSHVCGMLSSVPVSNVETKHPACTTPLVLDVEDLGFNGSLDSKTISSRGNCAVSLPCLHLHQVLGVRVSDAGFNCSSRLGAQV